MASFLHDVWRRLTAGTQRSPALELTLVFLAALGLRIVWAGVTPPWVAPDEFGHFTYVAHIVEQHQLPETGPYSNPYPDHSVEVDQSCSKTLCDRISALWRPRERELPRIPLSFDFESARLHRSPPEQRRSQAGSSATSYPPPYYLYGALFYGSRYDEPVLSRLQAVRIGSALLSALSCCFGYLLAYESTRRRSWARAIGLMMALMPMHAFIGGSANNDSAVFAATTALCWVGIRAVLAPRITGRQAALLGLLAGICLLCKPTSAPVVLTISGLLLYRAPPLTLRPLRFSLQNVKALVTFGAVAAAVELPWLIYRHVTSLRSDMQATTEGEALEAILGAGSHTFSSYLSFLQQRGAQYYDWLFIRSLWALFGWQEIALSTWIYRVILAGCLLAAVGLIVRVVRRPEQRSVMSLLLSLIVGQVLFLFIVSDYFMSYSMSGVSFGMQGRYFLPVLAPFMTLLLSGLSSLLGDHPLVPRLLPLAFLALHLASLAEMLRAYYAVQLG